MNIQISINGTERPIPNNTTIADLVSSLGLGDRRVAVEVNGAVVPHGEHAGTTLADGDRVEIVHAIGGG